MKSIVLTGGGTAGHVIPHLALLPNLEKNFTKIYYIGSHTGIEREIIAKHPQIEYFSVTTVKLRRSVDLRNMAIPFKLVKGVSDAKKILKRIKPDVVFSKGGFVAYPVVRAAAKLKIPVVAHESDMSLGLANRLSAKHCDVICTTFKKTANKQKMIHTGSPIRASVFTGSVTKIIQRHFNQLATLQSKGNLLIIGGSLGAAKINEMVHTTLNKLLPKFNIIHICGKGKIDNSIKQAGYIQLEFVNDIENYFAWADVVISRAGSNAMCELLALSKPTLFIPLATGRGDQIENAKEVLQHDAAMVLWESDMTQASFVEKVNALYKNKEKYKANTKAMGDLNGTEQIAQIIIKQTNN